MILTGAAGIKKPQTGGATHEAAASYKGLRGAVNLMDKTRLFGDLPEKGREALVQRFGSADYKALTPEMRKTFVKIISQDLTDELPRIKAPTLLILGRGGHGNAALDGQDDGRKDPRCGVWLCRRARGTSPIWSTIRHFLRIAKNFLLEGRA